MLQDPRVAAPFTAAQGVEARKVSLLKKVARSEDEGPCHKGALAERLISVALGLGRWLLGVQDKRAFSRPWAS